MILILSLAWTKDTKTWTETSWTNLMKMISSRTNLREILKVIPPISWSSTTKARHKKTRKIAQLLLQMRMTSTQLNLREITTEMVTPNFKDFRARHLKVYREVDSANRTSLVSSHKMWVFKASRDKSSTDKMLMRHQKRNLSKHLRKVRPTKISSVGSNKLNKMKD